MLRHGDLPGGERSASGLIREASRSVDHAIYAVAICWGGFGLLAGLAALVDWLGG